MEARSEGDLTWEEKLYWSHFRTVHFSQFLLTDFEDQLDIPDKFTNNLNRKLPENVTLRGPSGILWNVGLVKSDDTLAFKHGWKEFVRDNSLVENDFLIFKYNGESQFDVLMFDARSLCEKEAAYFVREEPGRPKQEGEGRKKETSTEIVLVSSPIGVGSSSLELTSDEEAFTAPSKLNNNSSTTEKLSRKKARCKSLPSKWSSRNRKVTSAAIVLHKYDDLDGLYPKRKVYAKQYVSNRRPVTEKEKLKTLQAAQSAANIESAVVIMRPTSVYRKFFVVIPKEWLRKHVDPENQDAIVRHGNKTWHMKFYYVKSRGCGGLSSGWRNFTVDNNLEEFDVCVFQLASSGTDIPITLDVTVFRVVDDIAPLAGVY